MQHPPKKKRSARSRRWILPALLMVLAAAAALVWLLPRLTAAVPAETQAEQQPTSYTLQITPPQQIASVTVFPSGGEAYTLRMQEGKLRLERDGALQDINELYAQELLEAVTEIVARMIVAEDASEVMEHLDDMGLDAPQASAHICYTDGREATLEVGAGLPETTYAYCRWSGSPAVYLCDVGVAEALNLTVNRLIPVEQPAIYASLVGEISIRNAHGECTLSFSDGTFGSVTEPFVYPLSEEASGSVRTALENFRLGTHEAAVTEENRAFFGFDEPLCEIRVYQYPGAYSGISDTGELETHTVDEQRFRFVIGREEGAFFYTCEYEGECYFVSRFLAEALVELCADDLLSRTPADLGDLSLSGVEIRTPDGNLSLQVSYQERVLPNNEIETDENGEALYDALVTLNGAESTADVLDELLSRLASFTAADTAPQEWKQPNEKPLWSMELTAVNGLVRRVEAWKLDLFTAVIAVDGVARHTVYSEAIDVLTEGFLAKQPGS